MLERTVKHCLAGKAGGPLHVHICRGPFQYQIVQMTMMMMALKSGGCTFWTQKFDASTGSLLKACCPSECVSNETCPLHPLQALLLTQILTQSTHLLMPQKEGDRSISLCTCDIGI